jgi:hypothetical protein
MELEPNSSKLSFDLNECEIDWRLGTSPEAHANYPCAFNGPGEAGMADQVSTRSFHYGYLDVDPNLIDLSSFFEDTLANTSSAARSDVSLGRIEHDSMNDHLPSADESLWPQLEADSLSFRSGSRIYPSENAALVTSHLVNGERSLSLWPNSEFIGSDTSAPKDAFLPELSVYPRSTLSRRSHGPRELLYCLEVDQTGLDYGDALEAPLSQHIPDRCGPPGNSYYFEQDGISSDIPSALSLNGMAAPMLDNFDFEKCEAQDDVNICVSPGDLEIASSYDRRQSLPQYSRDQELVSDGELPATVNINSPQVNPRSSRPVPTLDDLIGNFDLNPKPQPSKRKRSSFDMAGKEKVRLVRDRGACVICRSRKVSVSDCSWRT